MVEEKAVLQAASNDDERVYWGRAESDSLGIVVATAWMLSTPRQFNKHSSLYASCGWDCLVAHSKVLYLWFPTWARALAIRVLDKLVQELKDRPRPIVFATFSGGFKSCLYQMFEILNESYDGVDTTLAKYRIVRDCYAGQIHDSSPVDFEYTGGARFAADQIYLRTKIRNAAITRSTHYVAKAVDFVFHSRFERERADMWKVAHKTAAWGPVLVLCSKEDELAPFEIIEKYSSKLSSLGCKVTMIVWDNTPHVGHLQKQPDEYKSAVGAFLSDAVTTSALKMTHKSQNGFESDEIFGSIRGSAASSTIPGGQNVVHKDEDLLNGNDRVKICTDDRFFTKGVGRLHRNFPHPTITESSTRRIGVSQFLALYLPHGKLRQMTDQSLLKVNLCGQMLGIQALVLWHSSTQNLKHIREFCDVTDDEQYPRLKFEDRFIIREFGLKGEGKGPRWPSFEDNSCIEYCRSGTVAS